MESADPPRQNMRRTAMATGAGADRRAISKAATKPDIRTPASTPRTRYKLIALR